MKNLKLIFLLTIIAMFTIANHSIANIQNNLVQLDVKKSAVSNTVDVVLYTTSNTDNSVVTKKSTNKYVLLLPNTSSSASSFSTTGALKDLVTNVDIKSVNDNMGGYTKITFETTKPINIKTTNKKSTPLSQGQKETKDFLSKASTIEKQQIAQATPKPTPTVKKENPKQPPVQQQKVEVKPLPKIEQPKIEQNKQTKTETGKQKLQTTKNFETFTTVKEIISKANENKKNEIKQQVHPTAQNSEIEHKENGTNVKTDNELTSTNINQSDKTTSKNEQTRQTKNNEHTQNKILKNEHSANTTNSIPNNKNNLFYIGATIICGLLALKKLVTKKTKIRATTTTEAPKISADELMTVNQIKRTQEIAQNSKLNWQEKYNLVNGTQKNNKLDNNNSDYKFISIVNNNKTNTNNKPKHFVSQNITNKTFPTDKETLNNTSYSKQLKSFSKSDKIIIRKTNNFDNKLSLKQSMHLKIKETLSKSKRNQNKNSNSNIFSVINSGVQEMQKEKNGYIETSLNEYISMLDKKHNTSSVVSNPIARTNSNLAIKEKIEILSEYKISPNKNIYLISQKGRSAIVGKINNESFVLKKFDSVINESLQVRPDGNNVYIVKAGRYKCLVEITDSKMGTLIEI